MRIARVMALVAAMVLAIGLPAAALAQESPQSHLFQGTATVDGQPAADGTVVTAWIDDVEVGSGTVGSDPNPGFYSVNVDDPDQQYEGKTVVLKVGDAIAGETGTWTPGEVTSLDLTASVAPIPELFTEPVPEGDAGNQANDSQANDSNEKRKAFVGVVEGEPDDSAVTLIRKGTEEPITISLGNHELKTPGGKVAGSFADGANVVILAREDGDQWVAMWVLVKPTKPTAPPVTGAVVSVQDGVLTIMRPDGTTKVVQLGRGAASPKVGEVVTAFAGPSSADGVPGADGPPVAKGLVKASEVRQRLEGFLQDLTTGSGDLPEAASNRRAQSVVDIAAILEGHADKHVKLLEKLSQKDLPVRAAEGMRKALENAQRGRSQAKLKASEARTKAGPPEERGGGPGQVQPGAQPTEKGKRQVSGQVQPSGQPSEKGKSQAGGQDNGKGRAGR